jgi:hypothetical protein
MDVTVTTSEAAACLRLLKAAGGFLTAADIAARLRLGGCRETGRRRVRAMIDVLRNDGQWIVGFNPEGYLLTDDRSLWAAYNEGRKIDAKQVIGQASRRRMVTNDQGQGLLFAG